MTEPLISVIMPVYNGEKYLRDAVESILRQSFLDYEFIIVNDGSTDSSELIIQSYQDERIRYIKQENTGVGKALSLGCSLAKGKYIARMDADDISYPERLAIQIAYLEKSPDTVLVSNAVRYINSNGTDIGRSFPYTTNYSLKRKLKTMNPICHPSIMMNAYVYKKSIGYKNLQLFEDWVLWTSLSKYGKIHNFKFPLLKYRILNDSVSRLISTEQTERLFNYISDNIIKGDLTNEEIQRFNQLHNEEKLKGNRSFGMDEISNEMIREYSTSKGQLKLYNILKKLRFPEPIIELSICSLKNFLVAYNSLYKSY